MLSLVLSLVFSFGGGVVVFGVVLGVVLGAVLGVFIGGDVVVLVVVLVVLHDVGLLDISSCVWCCPRCSCCMLVVCVPVLSPAAGVVACKWLCTAPGSISLWSSWFSLTQLLCLLSCSWKWGPSVSGDTTWAGVVFL